MILSAGWVFVTAIRLMSLDFRPLRCAACDIRCRISAILSRMCADISLLGGISEIIGASPNLEVLFRNSEQFAHLSIEEALTRTIRLDPLAVDHELRNCALASVPDDLVRSLRIALDIDLAERNVVLFEEVLGLATIAAPERGIDGEIHASIVA